MTPIEIWLPLGAAAFYLYDSALLLWQNELVFVHAGRQWRVSGGSGIRLGSRRLFVPNPLTPHQPQFLVCWHVDPPPRGSVDADLTDLFLALRPVGILNLLHVALLAALPVALWSLGTGIAALAVFALFYLTTLAALIVVFRRRDRLGLSTRGFWALAFDTLACAPFAINMTRRLAMRHGLAAEPLHHAARHFDSSAHADTCILIAARIREEHAAPEVMERQQQILHTVLSRLER